MAIITGRENVLAVYENAAKKGWVIPCICSENLTTTEAVLSAASEFAQENGYDRIPVTLAITNQYDHRSQSVFYTNTRRWDIGLKLFRSDLEIVSQVFSNVDILIHLDHAQHDTDAEMLESDLSMFSSVMYDASSLPMEENIRKTQAYVKRKGHELLIEGACDEIVDATGTVRNALTTPENAAYYIEKTGVDMIVANLGTEHRATGKELMYHGDLARQIKERIGARIVLHGTSSVTNEQVRSLFRDGVCKVNIWTALERDSAPALTEWTIKNAAKCGGPKLEQKLIDEGYLTESSKRGDKASLQHYTTTARQEIIFGEMRKIVRGYLDLWYR